MKVSQYFNLMTILLWIQNLEMRGLIVPHANFRLEISQLVEHKLSQSSHSAICIFYFIIHIFHQIAAMPFLPKNTLHTIVFDFLSNFSIVFQLSLCGNCDSEKHTRWTGFFNVWECFSIFISKHLKIGI